MVNSWLKCDKIVMNLIKYIYHLKRNLVKRFIMVTWLTKGEIFTNPFPHLVPVKLTHDGYINLVKQ
jgi:hypothetical protein